MFRVRIKVRIRIRVRVSLGVGIPTKYRAYCTPMLSILLYSILIFACTALPLIGSKYHKPG